MRTMMQNASEKRGESGHQTATSVWIDAKSAISEHTAKPANQPTNYWENIRIIDQGGLFFSRKTGKALHFC